MKKWILVLLLLPVLALGGAVLWLDALVATAVEQGGRAATGVATHVDSVDAGFFQGHLGLAGLALDQPPGFSSGKLLVCRELRAEWDNGTLLDSRIRVRQLTLRGLALEWERNGSGGNWEPLLERISQQRSPGSSTPPPSGSTRSVAIDSIVLEDIRCGLTLSDVPIVGGRKELKLPRLELKGLQTDGDAAHIAGVVLEAVIQATLEELARSGVDFLPQDLLQDLKGQVKQLEHELRGEIDSQLRKLGNPFK